MYLIDQIVLVVAVLAILVFGTGYLIGGGDKGKQFVIIGGKGVLKLGRMGVKALFHSIAAICHWVASKL
jgi:hypothetical protein